ncbi:MAG: heat-inducible transcription repressor HrcA [Acidimicrobiia bacterium]|nr:heat-inducible transcription repressor HrcA [Acidimicrobiia bacterium]MYC58143.1 heat-inducible transcription repressor HrcA [Acidimicrobiia bacterium]MYG94370.1 heat-inducible transcription repressor HrcA [Acidimicrobiia bacterium]MYI30575.1 heat-inducible transcription repressor HrcA [Acidimicrobiia bacterium]
MSSQAEMLSARKAAVLRAVVEGYICTNQPVGSTYVSETVDLQASPATVRNEMLALEQAGYLHQPHTSAGRIPTEKGYRHFVDSLTDASATLGRSKNQQIKDFFHTSRNELEQMLADTSALLADLTAYAALVVAPDHSSANIRSVSLVDLSERVVLALVVYDNGVVDKRTIEMDQPFDSVELAQAADILTDALGGRPATDLHHCQGDKRITPLVSRVLGSLADLVDAEDQLYVGGTASVARLFDAAETVRSVLGILEKQLVVVNLVRDILDRGLNVAIGTETGVAPLAECSLIVASYEVDGQPVGSIGVLGPTRMNYPQALAAVAVVGQKLGDRLSFA